MKRTLRGLLVVFAIFGFALVTSPAYADEENPPNVKVEFDDCKAILTFDNSGPYTDGKGHNGPWPVAFDYRLPGDTQQPVEPELDGTTISDPPLAGQAFDGLYNKVPVAKGATEVVEVTLEPTDDKLWVRLVRGAEQRVFFDWKEFDIPAGTCVSTPPTTPAPASPSPSPTATPAAPDATDDDEEQLPATGVDSSGFVAAGFGAVAIGVVCLLAAAYLMRRSSRRNAG